MPQASLELRLRYLRPPGVWQSQSPGEIKTEEGGELDSHEEASPEDGDQEQGGGAGLESWTSFASVVSQRRSYAGHCLCDSVLHSSWDSGNCVVRWSLRNAGRTLP